MRLTLSTILIGAIQSQEIYDNFFDFNATDEYEADDAAWEAENCAIKCDDGACVLKSQICNSKRDCPKGEDEQNCHKTDNSDDNSDKKRDGRNKQPTTAAPDVNLATKVGGFRGRFPSFYAPQESAFRGFNEKDYAVFQRKNRRILQHVTGNDDNDRLEQMTKMMFFMTEGKTSLGDFMSYGCHCNADGSGHGMTQDDIDSACSRNAGCRKCATADFNCDPTTKYLVNGAIAGRIDGLACINRPDTCARSLCECDLQLIRDMISQKQNWTKSLHTFYGFDQETCTSFNSLDLGRSLHQGSVGNKSPAETQCCGKYPNRQPINGEGRSCCGDKSYNDLHFECCAGSDIVPIGSC